MSFMCLESRLTPPICKPEKFCCFKLFLFSTSIEYPKFTDISLFLYKIQDADKQIEKLSVLLQKLKVSIIFIIKYFVAAPSRL